MHQQEGTLGVAIVGPGFMGTAHSQGWRTAPRVFQLPLQPVMMVLCGRDSEAANAAAAKLGWEEAGTDWRAVLNRPDIQVVDICTPGDAHAEIAIAALEAGKHVLCEKPLANTLEEAAAMVRAADRARPHGVRSMVCFNYRRVPALALARQLIDGGRLGVIHQVRAAYMQDWLADPEYPLVWRLQRDRAGSGALGDLGSHVVDLAQFLLGDHLTGVTALLETFVRERPLPQPEDGRTHGPVTVDDCAFFTGRFSGGAIGTFEATRVASGRKNALRIEVHGSAGSLAFDLESLNELWFYDRNEDPMSAGFRRILVTEPSHPYVSGWWPPGHVLGWEHTFSHEIADFVKAVADARDPSPSFEEGLQVQRVLAAVEDSGGAACRWTAVTGDRLGTAGSSSRRTGVSP
jgi:predicted dehydrogenase